MNNNNEKLHTFIKRSKLGKCPLCGENVYNDRLYVENNGEYHHYSCINNKKKDDEVIEE